MVKEIESLLHFHLAEAAVAVVAVLIGAGWEKVAQMRGGWGTEAARDALPKKRGRLSKNGGLQNFTHT